MILACRPVEGGGALSPKVVKALGLPEVEATRQLVAETVGNATARHLRVTTPTPCVVHIDAMVARTINQSLKARGYDYAIKPGAASGCELIRPAPSPYTAGDALNDETRIEAVRLYVSDLLSQNSDRRKENVNCGWSRSRLLAFDFEMCFAHLFLPIIGGLLGNDWEPSKAFPCTSHLFHSIAKASPPDPNVTEMNVTGLSSAWWGELRNSLPASWHLEADKIGVAIQAIVAHAHDFAQDVQSSL